MRIVTRADFDGIVCAALLYEAEHITHPVRWVEPGDMQRGVVKAAQDDIIANLPFAAGCAFWFDHHVTNKATEPVKGLFRVAPSAARLVFEYYYDRFQHDYTELIQQTDDIDSANLTMDQVLEPEKYPYLLLSMTISSRNKSEEPYWNHLVQLLRATPIVKIMKDDAVRKRGIETVNRNRLYKDILIQHTKLLQDVAVTDLRSFDPAPEGNRFFVYSLFPDSMVAIKLRYASEDREKVIISVGHSIFNPICKVNVGEMLSNFGGGGHVGAGATTVNMNHADSVLKAIVEILQKNQA